MPAKSKEVSQWLEEGARQSATHLIVVYDCAIYQSFPVYVLPDEDVGEVAAQHGKEDSITHFPTEPNDQRRLVAEVYNLAEPLEPQVEQARALNF